ncbi:MAG: sigma-70 family RNA polymerase sigma factor [Acidobacteriota bacterium]|nr:sigma-70 family RNA polymerase sigma factor [Acidobacteriota bacterium]
MPDDPQTGVTQLLREAGRGDSQAVGLLFERVYDELRSIARGYLRDERTEHTLQATALVHEAYLRLVGAEQIEWQNRAQFFSIAAQVMRHILVDHARRHAAGKRGSGERRLSLDEAVSFAEERDVNLVALDDALKTLETLDSEQARIVELRFFGGLSIKEIAEVLGVSETTVSRKWNTAKLWLRAQLADR